MTTQLSASFTPCVIPVGGIWIFEDLNSREAAFPTLGRNHLILETDRQNLCMSLKIANFSNHFSLTCGHFRGQCHNINYISIGFDSYFPSGSALGNWAAFYDSSPLKFGKPCRLSQFHIFANFADQSLFPSLGWKSDFFPSEGKFIPSQG